MIEVSNCGKFKKIIKKGKIIVDFWAEWCGPCRVIGPILEELEKENDFELVKVNVDNCPEIMDEFDISSIPTIMYFVNGKHQATKIGIQSKDTLIKMIS